MSAITLRSMASPKKFMIRVNVEGLGWVCCCSSIFSLEKNNIFHFVFSLEIKT